MNWEVIQGESLEAMRGMADSSFALIVADPPYFKVKDDDWDNQWKTKTEFLAWIRLLCVEWQRLLRLNGSLYVFASPQLARELGNIVAERFSILTDIRWQKPEFSTKAEMFHKEDLRAPFPASETVWFAEQYGADSIAKGEAGCDGFVFEPLRVYIADECRRAGVDTRRLKESWMAYKGNKSEMPRHWIETKQFELPTAENYEWLRATLSSLNHGGEYLLKEYEDLRKEHEVLRREYEDLRRPFNATTDAPYTDVWTFPTVGNYKGKHPCQKPLEMMRHIVKVSSREGDAVLDAFAGSFVLGDAALSLNRSYVGVDGSAHWCEQGQRKLSLLGKQGSVTLHSVVEFKRANERVRADRVLPLFENVA